MKVRRFVIASAAWAAVGLMALSAQAQTPPRPVLSPAFERAVLDNLDAATRAEVEKRATGGNTVQGVIETMMLNSNQMTKHGKPGGAITVVAVDFFRGVVVIQTAPNEYEPVRFDPKTLQVLS